MGCVQTFTVCRIFKFAAFNFETVPLSKLTTNRAVPSLEIARLRAALPVVTVPILFLVLNWKPATFPELFKVT